MKVINSNYDQAIPSSNTTKASQEGPTTFFSPPAEIRNIIYDLSGCLEARQADDLKINGTCFAARDHGGNDYCLFCSVCSKDGTQCHLYFELAESNQRVSLWVNRNSSLTTMSYKDVGSKSQRLRHNYLDHARQLRTPVEHGAHIKNGVEQPGLSKVSKQMRNDTLPIFYGSHSFFFTLFDRDMDSASIFKWLRTIGKHNAALLKHVRIVSRSKKDVKYAENELKPALKKHGLNVDGAADVMVATLPYPFCYCERCVREALGEMRRR